jgi:threonine dehydrogenase-like Zn-dependent dehydrogenase
MKQLVRSAVAVAPGRTAIQRLPLPEISSSDALLDVEACGVCGSDWPLYTQAGRPFPLILGHEMVGRIREIGDLASAKWGVVAGDRVAVQEFLPCWACDACWGGRYQLCARTDVRANSSALRYGSTPLSVAPALWGGYSEVVYLHPDSLVHPLVESVPAELGTLFVPLSNGVRWVGEDGALPPGGTVVIYGPGQHGLGCVVAARERGASRIVVVGLHSDRNRLEVAQALGAHATVEADREDVVRRVLEETGGVGADLGVDVTPAPETLRYAVEGARLGGRIVVAGGKPTRTADVISNDVVKKELTVVGVRGRGAAAVQAALKTIAGGAYPLEAIATDQRSLDHVDWAIRAVGRNVPSDCIHVTITP